MSDAWRLRALRWSYVTFIAAASTVTTFASLRGGHHGGHPVLFLAVVELLAALAFLIEPIEIVACIVLLLVYAAAIGFSLFLADYLAPLRFMFFAAVATYIVAAHRSPSAVGASGGSCAATLQE